MVVAGLLMQKLPLEEAQFPETFVQSVGRWDMSGWRLNIKCAVRKATHIIAKSSPPYRQKGLHL